MDIVQQLVEIWDKLFRNNYGKIIVFIYYILYNIYYILYNMYFLVNKDKKIIFGWSAKCGCSHIKKIFYYFENNEINNIIHQSKDYKGLPENIEDYKIILFIRNPYKRLVSGFMDKYKKNGEFNCKWNINLPLTFSNFVDKIIQNSDIIDNHHFVAQTGEMFDYNKLNNFKNLNFFDIENIDYGYIENIFDKKIPKELIDFRGGHTNNSTEQLNCFVYHEIIYDIEKYKIPTIYYFNETIKNKVYNFYKQDFLFFAEKGYYYDL